MAESSVIDLKQFFGTKTEEKLIQDKCLVGFSIIFQFLKGKHCILQKINL